MAGDGTTDRELELAREVQLSILPDFMPRVSGYDVAGNVWPATETGGDTYDLVAIDENNIFILLADATGHDIGATLSAVQMQAMMRLALRLGADLDDGFRHINAQMVEDLPDDRFVTACFGILDTRSHRFQFHSAGQGPILHYHAKSGEFQWYEPSSLPLGFMEHREDHKSRHMQLAEGDLLALISDGIYDYENEEGERFGTERVSLVLQEQGHLPMEDLVTAMFGAVQAFGGAAPQQDDATIVFVKYTGEQPDPGQAKREFKRSLASLDDIFAFTEEYFVSRGIDSSLRYAVDLALDELFSNMVRHNADVTSDILIEFHREDNGISVSMTDHEAVPFDVTRDAPPVDIDAPVDEREAGGLGIHLVKNVVDTIDYDYDDDRCKITFTKKPG